jgi:rSAM/selenodomain-associated transferase 2
MISIIVPIYNEEDMLSKASAHLQRLSREAELIFADGGSTDRGVDVARGYGKVFSGEKGRALQMNYGARQAKGDILLFLHADTMVSADTLGSIERKIMNDGYVGGCLTQRIDNKAFIYRLIEWQGNVRAAMTKEFYGDQGIFVKKDIFSKAGGFPEVPIMEDVFFTQKLRACGKTVMLPDKILVSARRWEKKGVIKTTLLFNLVVLLSWLRVPLHTIKKLYEDLR